MTTESKPQSSLLSQTLSDEVRIKDMLGDLNEFDLSDADTITSMVVGPAPMTMMPEGSGVHRINNRMNFPEINRQIERFIASFYSAQIRIQVSAGPSSLRVAIAWFNNEFKRVQDWLEDVNSSGIQLSAATARKIDDLQKVVKGTEGLATEMFKSLVAKRRR